jgi:hypothetical protein
MMNLHEFDFELNAEPDAAPGRVRKPALDPVSAWAAMVLVAIALLLAVTIGLHEGAPDSDAGRAAPATPVQPALVQPADYFPNGYVNRATEPEKQYDTF